MKKKYMILVAFVFSFLLIGCSENPKTDLDLENKEIEENLKKVDYFSFGSYVPNSSRNILAIVESKQDIQLTANLNGSLEKIFVKIGDTVRAGDILARYKLSNDVTQISYDNALVGLQSAKNSAENSVKSAEIALDASRREYEQAIITQEQSVKQSFYGLDSSITAATTELKDFIDWADRTIGVSENGIFGEFDNFSKIIGSNNSIQKLNAKNQLESIRRKFVILETKKSTYLNLTNNQNALLEISKEQLDLLFSLRSVSDSVVDLVRKTPITSSFSQTQKNTFEQQANTYQAKINGAYASLKNAREGSIAAKEQVAGALLSAKNRIKNAEAQLELTISNTASQISQANSQVRIAGKSKQDLSVRAPFSGKVTEILVSEFQNINPGTPLLGLISEAENKTKITAQLSKDEYELFIGNGNNIKAIFPNGKEIELIKDEYSDTINPITQKTKIILTPKESINVPVGSVLTLQIPLQKSKNSILIDDKGKTIATLRNARGTVFSNGYSIVRTGSQSVFYDVSGKPAFADKNLPTAILTPFIEQHAVLKEGIINSEGDWTYKFDRKNQPKLSGKKISDGVILMTQTEGAKRIINITSISDGKTIASLPAEGHYHTLLGNGLLKVRRNSDNLSALFDRLGNPVTEFKYDGISEFSHGFATVRLEGSHVKHVINTSGKIIYSTPE